MTGCHERIQHDAIVNSDPSFSHAPLGLAQQAHPCACRNFWVRRQSRTGCRCLSLSLVIAGSDDRAVVPACHPDVRLSNDTLLPMDRQLTTRCALNARLSR